MLSPLEVLDLPFARTAAAEILLLAVAGGTLGSWVLLRRLVFFTHAVGAAAFPALLVAAPIGVAPQIAGVAAGLGFAAAVERGARFTRDLSAATGLVLVACLAGGVILASDAVRSPSSASELLFGSLLGLSSSDVALSAAAAALGVAATVTFGRAWVATGFDPEGAAALAFPAPRLDAVLLAVVAVAAVAAVPAVGALLATSLFVVPAATARLVTSSVRRLFPVAVAVAGVQGLAGLYLAFALDIPPGPAIAVLGAGIYGSVALGRAAQRPGGSAVLPT